MLCTTHPAIVRVADIAPAPRRAILFSALAATLLPATSICGADAVFYGRAETQPELPRDFRLQDGHNRWRTLADFRGTVVLVFFGYTQCPDVCPTELTRLARLKTALDKDADRVQVVFITIDPERDTAEIMRDYPALFHPSFVGLRGTPQGTLDATRTFKVYAEKMPGPTPTSYTVDHSTFVYGFDSHGKLRVRLTPTLTADQMLTDVRTLLSIP